MRDYKVIMAPVNISGQPKMLVDGLNRLGVHARLFQYGKHKFGYADDIVVEIGDRDRSTIQLESLQKMIEMDFDIFHFWFRTFYYGSYYDGFPGLDLPLIKSAGKKIVYRFTGYDLRMATLEKRLNPWNAYQYGFEPLFDEVEQKKYLDYLNGFVDQFVVQDIEMESYMLELGLPRPRVIPRSIDLNDWPYQNVKKTSRPLVIHAPSKSVVKGTSFILQAVAELQEEGLEFDFKLIQGMPHSEAKGWFKKCDIAIDQLLIGWYGVFSMECMALGKPVIVYIRDDLWERASPRIPVLNANPSNIKETLKEAILNHKLREQVSLKQRAYVEEVHDVSIVSRLMADTYDTVMEKRSAPADVSKVVPHVQHQVSKMRRVSTQGVFNKQASGYSLNQDHVMYRLLKRVKRVQRTFKSNVIKKRERLKSWFN